MAKGTVNKVLLLGRLGQDPDVRYSQSGTAVAKFSLATNERVPAGNGEYKDETEWHRVVVFGKPAEFCGNYLTKGKLAYIEGRIRTNQWEDSEGNKRYSTEIIATQVQGVGGGEGNGGNDSNQGNGQGKKSTKSSGSSKKNTSHDDDFGGGLPPDDDIPF